MAIHKNYLLLTDAEREELDGIMQRAMWDMKRACGVSLGGDDRAEHAAEAMATWVIESRGAT